jgi:hypothetical protein
MSEQTPAAPAAPAHKIVIVAGQEFTVPATAADNDIRQTLVAQGFADVASAEIKRSKRDGVEVMEFVKKAGTKGLTGPDLAALLRRTPPAAGDDTLPGVTGTARDALRRLTAGRYTIGEALHDPAFGELLQLLEETDEASPITTTEEVKLCDTLDRLPAVAAAAPCAW